MNAANCLSKLLVCAGMFGLNISTLSASGNVEQVNWYGPAGSRIKAVRYFEKDVLQTEQMMSTSSFSTTASTVIDSPPLDGFVPWIVLVATNRRESGDLDWEARIDTFVRGSFPAGVNTQTDFMIGIYDTGASAHVLGYQNAVTAGLYNSTYLTTNTTLISGVTGSVSAYVSMPLALYMAGLNALEPNSPGDPDARLNSTAGMMGQSNISVLIGDNPGSYPDIYTAVGSPMSAYYIAHFDNSTPVTVIRNGQTFTAPRITFYQKDDDTAPSYPNKVPLELRPLGAVNVQYTITLDSGVDFKPATPSVIIGNSSQSLFFVHSVDLQEGGSIAFDKDRFMLDTGAQITVIGSRVAARLGLNPAQKEFEVDIEGVTGESIEAPGFYIDAITIPALGQWLEYTNVPVILLDISSPEGGTLDGIIGMNLFTEYNLILRGGGFFLEDDPMLEFEQISGGLVGDIAPPPDGDGVVNYLDFSVFSAAWLTDSAHPYWNPDADLMSSEDVGFNDLLILADNWLVGAMP